jgi:GT2 family glycosyltransferase
MTEHTRIAAVLIGRNEGERLKRALAAIPGTVDQVVYVDSGSTDGSVDAARSVGAQVVELDTAVPFTAARARNAGLALVTPDTRYVQFIDGDCEVQPDWIDHAAAFLDANPNAAVACGRRRERHPEASIYNRLIDAEWSTPVGEAKSCGGDAMMRLDALAEVNGFNPFMIAGEEPELCVRLRQAGWQIHRLDAEMTLHDADIHRFGQWWRRAERAGHAYAEGAALHGAAPEQHNVARLRRAVIWGGAIPILSVAGLTVTPYAPLLMLAWPLQIARLTLSGAPALHAVFLTLAKLPEAIGAARYAFRRATGRSPRLIEYK